MAKEDISLPVEMEKLEIEPVKNKNNLYANPFVHLQQRKHIFIRTSTPSFSCYCSSEKNKKSIAICKKKNHNRVLKKPVLQLLRNYCSDVEEVHKCQKLSKSDSSLQTVNSENILCALVDNCNQLRISSEREEDPAAASTSNDKRWWKKNSPCSSTQNKESSTDKSRAGPSCSQEALNPPCDVTIDELASYFETFVHIPKKMSSMAEMMYI